MPATRPRVFIHVGLPKTGTTYLQDRLWRNRDIALRTSNLLYPGNEMADHFHAAVHLQPDRYLDWVDPAHAGAWDLLRGQMRAWPGTSILSHELYSTATQSQAASVIADLDFADVHVAVTVRDLARQIPSVWQENVKNQHRSTLDDFIASLRDHPVDQQEPFWEFQDYVRILHTWGASLPAANVHVVTVPRSAAASAPAFDNGDADPLAAPGASSLWERFVDLIGADGAALTRSVPPSNTALSPAQVELVRRVNEHLQPGDIPWDRYERAIKRELIGSVLFGSDNRAGRTLSPAQAEWAAGQSNSMIADVQASGFDVVGDLEDLRIGPITTADTGEPSVEETLDVTISALADLLKTMPLGVQRQRLRTRVKAVARRGHRRLVALRRRRRARAPQ